MFEHVKVVAQMSIIVNWNTYSGEMESMMSAREEMKHITSSVDFQEYAM